MVRGAVIDEVPYVAGLYRLAVRCGDGCPADIYRLGPLAIDVQRSRGAQRVAELYRHYAVLDQRVVRQCGDLGRSGLRRGTCAVSDAQLLRGIGRVTVLVVGLYGIRALVVVYAEKPSVVDAYAVHLVGRRGRHRPHGMVGDVGYGDVGLGSPVAQVVQRDVPLGHRHRVAGLADTGNHRAASGRGYRVHVVRQVQTVLAHLEEGGTRPDVLVVLVSAGTGGTDVIGDS